jgi:hypothetical protein
MVIFEERRDVLEKREFAILTEIARTKSKADTLSTNADGMSKPIDTLTELTLEKLSLTFVGMNPDSQVTITLFAGQPQLLHPSIREFCFFV